MSGERDLQTLLGSMAPDLDPATYVFASVARGAMRDADSLMRFSEAEGDTLILRADVLPEGTADDGRRFRRITLAVHSDLEAVGLTAAFAARLTAAGISANVVAGYYHDHIFVPESHADAAMAALRHLSVEAQQAAV